MHARRAPALGWRGVLRRLLKLGLAEWGKALLLPRRSLGHRGGDREAALRADSNRRSSKIRIYRKRCMCTAAELQLFQM
eukprot:4077678-Pleurochrysis_carterae.AAC.1